MVLNKQFFCLFGKEIGSKQTILDEEEKEEERKRFLVADTQLYKRLCPSVRPLVGRSVGWSVGRSMDTS